ncbi:hypothetical protein [Actinoallomurus liliacearum]|uniref:hypothetical protein n=1 Tax=Actinoallomurus liliacearum TaxID=1080073 RepID=UPI0031E74ED1
MRAIADGQAVGGVSAPAVASGDVEIQVGPQPAGFVSPVFMRRYISLTAEPCHIWINAIPRIEK